MTNRSSSAPEHRKFSTDICWLLKPQNPRARSLFSFIRRTLRQFHLEGVHSESEIFNEAYLRGSAAILKGVIIHSPNAWMRKTTFNIIREFSRYHQRHPCLDHESLERFLVPENLIEQDVDAVQLSVIELLTELELSDRRIVELRTVENLSWKDVRLRLVELGEALQTEPALRKRGQRAMQRLREIYHQKRPAE